MAMNRRYARDDGELHFVRALGRHVERLEAELSMLTLAEAHRVTKMLHASAIRTHGRAEEALRATPNDASQREISERATVCMSRLRAIQREIDDRRASAGAKESQSERLARSRAIRLPEPASPAPAVPPENEPFGPRSTWYYDDPVNSK